MLNVSPVLSIHNEMSVLEIMSEVLILDAVLFLIFKEVGYQKSLNISFGNFNLLPFNSYFSRLTSLLFYFLASLPL